jgi:hypothetical protein
LRWWFGRELRFAAVDDNPLTMTLTGNLDVWTFRLGPHAHQRDSISQSSSDNHSLGQFSATLETATALEIVLASFGGDWSPAARTESTDALDGWILATEDRSRQDDLLEWHV